MNSGRNSLSSLVTSDAWIFKGKLLVLQPLALHWSMLCVRSFIIVWCDVRESRMDEDWPGGGQRVLWNVKCANSFNFMLNLEKLFLKFYVALDKKGHRQTLRRCWHKGDTTKKKNKNENKMEELHSQVQTLYHNWRELLEESGHAELAMEYLQWVIILLPGLWFDLAWSATVSYNRSKQRYGSYIYAMVSCVLVQFTPLFQKVWIHKCYFLSDLFVLNSLPMREALSQGSWWAKRLQSSTPTWPCPVQFLYGMPSPSQILSFNSWDKSVVTFSLLFFHVCRFLIFFTPVHYLYAFPPLKVSPSAKTQPHTHNHFILLLLAYSLQM